MVIRSGEEGCDVWSCRGIGGVVLYKSVESGRLWHAACRRSPAGFAMGAGDWTVHSGKMSSHRRCTQNSPLNPHANSSFLSHHSESLTSTRPSERSTVPRSELCGVESLGRTVTPVWSRPSSETTSQHELSVPAAESCSSPPTSKPILFRAYARTGVGFPLMWL